MSVYFTNDADNYFNELIDLLYDKQYFSFKENATEYVSSLTDEIIETLSIKAKHIAPKYFYRFGKNMYYASFRKSTRTTWYVFFTLHGSNFLVRYITNNHVSAQHIRGLK